MSSAYLEKSRVTQKVIREWMTHSKVVKTDADGQNTFLMMGFSMSISPFDFFAAFFDGQLYILFNRGYHHHCSRFSRKNVCLK